MRISTIVSKWTSARRQWRKWSLPTRLGLILGGFGAIGVLATAAAWYRPDFWRRPDIKTSAHTTDWRRQSRSASLKFISIDCSDSEDTHPTGLNDNAEVVGICQVTKGQQGFHGDARGRLTRFDYPDTEGSTNATGVNNHGDIVGFYYDAVATRDGPPSHGFLRRADATFSSFDYPGTKFTFAHAINDNGEIVGAYLDDSRTTRGFLRKSDGSFSELACPGAVSTTPTSINNRSEIVGYCTVADFGDRGFLLRPDQTFQFIRPNDVTSTQPKSINDRGVIVGLTNMGAFLRLADGSFQVLEHPACVPGSCTIPTGINNRGEVVGQYQRGSVRGFIASP